MIITIGLVSIPINSHNYFFFVMGTFKMYSLRKFQIHNIVLFTIFTMLYLRLLELNHLITGIFTLD